MELAEFIRDVPDFPEVGIVFKDITPLLADGSAFEAALAEMAEPFVGAAVDFVSGVEARGFLFGTPIARLLNVGFVPIRKAGKLPADVIGVDYELEYGTDRVELNASTVSPGSRVLLVDDVLATGGTLAASVKLIEEAGGHVVGASVLINLVALGGAAKLSTTVLHSVLEVN